MKIAFLLFLTALVGGAVLESWSAAPAAPTSTPVWFTEQITIASVDSNNFITGGQAGHATVTVLEFSSKLLCEEWLAANGFLRSGVDVPLGTGSYFARVGALFSECKQK